MAGKRAKKPEETERISKEAGKPKGPIKYLIELNEEQRESKALIYNNKITILTGKAGSGKTLAAVITALDMVFKKEVKKIYITRPVVSREDIGFLPGDIAAKLDPYLVPIYENLYKCYNEDKINQLIEQKVIIIAPIGFMRGRTFDDCVLIIDEAQNVDDESYEMCLTRIGKNGRVVICGDSRQIDLKKKHFSGLNFLVTNSNVRPGFVHLDLKANHRDEIVEYIIDLYEKKREDEKEAVEAAKRKKKQ